MTSPNGKATKIDLFSLQTAHGFIVSGIGSWGFLIRFSPESRSGGGKGVSGGRGGSVTASAT